MNEKENFCKVCLRYKFPENYTHIFLKYKTKRKTLLSRTRETPLLMDADSTNGAMSVFELVVLAGAKVPLPHYHEAFDEALYVIEGIMTFTIDGKDLEISKGESCFIPKGIVHGFNNMHDSTVKALSVITPALLALIILGSRKRL